MGTLSAVLHFWLTCTFKALGDLAAFVGTNKTGLLFDSIVAVTIVGNTLYRTFRQQGWSSMKGRWWSLIGPAVFIGLGYFAFVFLFFLVASPHGLYREAEDRKADSEKSMGAQVKSCQGTVANLQATLQAGQFEAAQLTGITKTLEKQNRDQQTTINGCLSQAMKLLTPEPFKMTAVSLDSDTSKPDAKYSRWILLTNKPITPVKMAIGCNNYVEFAVLSPVGTSGLGMAGNRLSPTAWVEEIDTPAWTPTTPFMVKVVYKGSESLVCSFGLR